MWFLGIITGYSRKPGLLVLCLLAGIILRGEDGPDKWITKDDWQGDPFWTESSLDLVLRSAFYRQQNEVAGSPLASSWAVGGHVLWESGTYREWFRTGFGFYTSNRLYGPAGQGGTRLLKPDQGNINVLGQAYAEFIAGDWSLKVYRQELDTPFINAHYDRMIPQLFEAYGVSGRLADSWQVSLSYVSRELDRGSSAFHPLSSVAGNRQQDRGLVMAGLQWKGSDAAYFELWEYYGIDMYNTLYTEGGFRSTTALEGLHARLAMQAVDQRSVGSAILGSWNSQMLGLLAGLDYAGIEVSLRLNQNYGGMGTTAAGAPLVRGIYSPWGRYPGFNKSTVLDFNGPQRTVLGAWFSWDMSSLGTPFQGLSLSLSQVYALPGSGGPAAAQKCSEFDLIVDYELPWVSGLHLEVRGSWGSYYDDPGFYTPAINDYRVILNYRIPIW